MKKKFIIPLLILILLRSQLFAQMNNIGNMYISPYEHIYIAESFLNESTSSFLNDGNLFITGNFSNNQDNNDASFGDFHFIGSSLQAISGSKVPSFRNLQLNNSAGINLFVNAKVYTNLDFISGKINTGSSKISLANGSSITGSGQSTGWVYGNLERNTNIGSNILLPFELGDNSNYTPATLLLNSVLTSGQVLAAVTNTDHPSISSSEINPSKSVNRHWSFTNSPGLFTTASLTLNWVSPDEDAGSNATAFKAGNYLTPFWEYPASTPNPNSITISNLSSLGDLAVGEYNCAGIAPSRPGRIISGQKYNLCDGGTFTYSIDPVPGATSYNWTIPNTFTNVVNNNSTSVTVTIPQGIDNEKMFVTASNVCGTSPVRTLNFWGRPDNSTISGLTCVNANQTGIQYRVTNPAPNVIYTWKVVPGKCRITSGQGTSSIIVDWSNTNGWLSVVASNDCGRNRDRYNVTVGGCSSVTNNKPQSQQFILYPNPTKGLTNVIFTSYKEAKYAIILTDITGKQLMHKELIAIKGDNKTVLDLSKYSKGVYMVSILNNEGINTFKVIKGE